MAWLAVNEDGKENIYRLKPIRKDIGTWSSIFYSPFPLPKGSIKKLIGRELSWEDKPVELKEE